MKMDVASKSRYFYEYLFWRAIETHNAEVREGMAAGREGVTPDDMIRTSEARALRTSMHNVIRREALADGGQWTIPEEYAKMSRFMRVMNETLRERLGYEPYPRTVVESNGRRVGRYGAAYDEGHAEFCEMIGSSDGGKTITEDGEHFVPVSPYDFAYKDRWTMRDNADALLGVPLDTTAIDDARELTSMTKGRFVAVTHRIDLDLSRTDDGRLVNPTPSYRVKAKELRGEQAPMLVNDSDITQMAVLSPYIPRSDFDALADWVAQGQDLSDMSSPTLHTRLAMMRRAEAVLDELDKLGRDYRIVKDTNPGQLKVLVTGTKVNFRLTDTLDNAQYVGRAYDNGVSMMFGTTRPDKAAGGNSHKRAPMQQTPDDVRNMVRFALGERFENEGVMVGEAGTRKRSVSGRDMEYNAAYYGKDGGFNAVYGAYRPRTQEEQASEARFRNVSMIRVNASDRVSETTRMSSPEEARAYLEQSIADAREGYVAALDVERLIEYAEQTRALREAGDEAGFVPPQFDGDPEIASIQMSYWDVLSGRRDTLVRPGMSYDENVGDTDDVQADSFEAELRAFEAVSYPYEGIDPADIVRAHAADSVDHVVGTYGIGEDGRRFDPVGVAKWNTNAYGIYRNNDDIVKALRMVGISADELRGDTFYNGTVRDRLIRFDEASSVVVADCDRPFTKAMGEEVIASLRANGVSLEDDDVRIDANGIISWHGTIATNESVYDRSGKRRPPREVRGEIGQIFEPDERGVVKTAFAGSDNYAFVPGYEAHVLHQSPGEHKTMEERTRLRGYEQLMREAIRYQVRRDMLDCVSTEDTLGEPTSVNATYSRLYDDRYDIDFERRYLEQGMPQEVIDALIKTQAGRVRYSNELREGSTINAAIRADRANFADDNFSDPFVLTGGRNVAVLTEQGDGYFDPIATTATSTNQGTVRYLTEDAQVAPDGSIIPGAKDGRCALMSSFLAEFSEYDPFDRQCMMFSSIVQANSVIRNVGVAQMTAGLGTMDDGNYVRKQWAEDHPMRMHDDLRSLVAGDKLSELHGNKGVTNKVIDPDMTEEEAKAAGAPWHVIQLFHDNPELDIITAPFPSVSRYNAGTAREMMSHESKPLIVRIPGEEEPQVIEGGIGFVTMVVTDKSADKKTSLYDEEEFRAGKGRRASAQLAWSLASKDCPGIMREFFGNNGGNIANVREWLITCGMDMDETGNLRMGYAPHQGEVRNVMEMPALSYRYVKGRGDTMTPRLDVTGMMRDFTQTLSRKGGVMELPFALQFPTGEDIPPLNDGKTDVVYRKDEWERKGYTRKDGVYVRPTTVRRHADASTQRQTGDVTWGLPVMSSYLRSGQTFVDGTSSVHDYTNHYANIFRQAVLYRDMQAKLDGMADKESAEATKLRDGMTRCQETAQRAFSSITDDVVERHMATKHNFVREEVMSARLPNSATAIWTADPSLGIDEVAIGPKMANVLGLDFTSDEPQYLAIWRDPILRDSGMRYMRAKLDPSLTGVSINPAADKPFDGDFDGDTIGAKKLSTKSAQREAMMNFSWQANLLDVGHRTTVVDPATGKERECFPLSMNSGLDVQVAMHFVPELEEEWRRFTIAANEIYDDHITGIDTDDEFLSRGSELLGEINGFYTQKVPEASFGRCVIRTDSVESHMQSVYDACIKTGAKGSPKKFLDYATYFGCDGIVCDENGLDMSGMTDHGHTLATRKMQEDVMFATAVKSFGTGIAGAVSQRAIAALRNTHPQAVLEITYPATQGLLQAKHDAEDAKRRFVIVSGPMRHLWNGALMEQKDGAWRPVYAPEGGIVKATPEEWTKQFMAIYEGKDSLGVSINPEFVEQVAKDMTGPDGLIMGVEDMECSPMDTLAYHYDLKGFDKLQEMCAEGRNLFEGRCNAYFAPYVIRDNQRVEQAAKAFEESGVSYNAEQAREGLKAVVKSDTVESGHERRQKTHRSSVSAPKRREPDTPTSPAGGSNPGDFGDA